MSMPFVAAGGYGAGLDLWLLLGGAAALAAGLIVLLMARKPAASGALGDGPRRPDEPPTQKPFNPNASSGAQNLRGSSREGGAPWRAASPRRTQLASAGRALLPPLTERNR